MTSIDRKERKVSLSVKAHDAAEEKQAMAEYGSSDSGASLGDILGAALNRANEERSGDDDAAEEAPEAAADDNASDAAEEEKSDE